MAILALDAGGTRLKLAVVENAQVVSRTTIESHSKEGLAARLPAIAEAFRALIPAGAALEGIGVAFPSLISSERIVGSVGKFEDAETLDLHAWALGEFGLPLSLDNDARLATIGEWLHGAAQGSRNVVMVTLGTGIGTGVIVDGNVLRGQHGGAGILGGHMTTRIEGHECPCGNVGCWETEASTAALPRMAEEDAFCAGSSLKEYAAVFAAAEAGDACATRLRDRSLVVWGALAVSLVHAYDPEILVFGGGVMAAGEAVLGSIRETVSRHAWPKARVVASELGDDAALIGCEWLVMG